ncbi:hypothetical protein LZC95_20075 [Pendulispora brunnea]|uniref:PE-PGRS family protein n=1 Tax=Pendulispora brunnea TaxID=2905690 RepID=A0ABZ2KTS0_9BACT
MKRWLVGSVVVFGAAGLAFLACTNPSECAFGHCGGALDGGQDANQVAWPAGCDPSADPTKSLACVDDSVGVFVSPNGSENGAGTKASPLKSINKAQEKGPLKPRIYVCVGAPYKEHVKLQRAQSIYGGFDCGTWQAATGTETTRVEPDDPGYALEIPGVPNDATVGGDAFTIADIAFTSKDAVNAGESSIAGWITQSKGLTLKRVSLTAGKGKDGVPSTEPTIDPYNPPTAPKGVDSDGGAPGGEQVNDCSGLEGPNNRSVGAGGGEKGAPTDARGGDGGTGQRQMDTGSSPNDAYNGVGGQGVTPSGFCGGAGDTGAHLGAYGAGGTKSEVSPPLGTVTATGYRPPNGQKGGDGLTGQGGGGGAGKNGSSGGPGGGGGAGGCGGRGGGGGQAGGSSIALLTFRSKVNVVDSTLAAGTGGKGAHGGKGQKAQAGGAFGTPGSGDGCPGARGGHGGSGAGGNGGAGGSSIALAFAGDAPSINGAAVSGDVDTQPGWMTTPSTNPNHGVAGAGGDPVSSDAKAGAPGNDGPDGIVKAVATMPAAP